MKLKADTPIKQLDAVLNYLYEENTNLSKQPVNYALFKELYEELIGGIENIEQNRSDGIERSYQHVRFMELILSHLVKDGYAEPYTNKYITSLTAQRKGNDLNWRITFSGYYFYQSEKGYSGVAYTENEANQKLLNDKQKEFDIKHNQTELQKGMNHLTRWIAGGTIVAGIYYLLEVVKWFLGLGSPSCG